MDKSEAFGYCVIGTWGSFFLGAWWEKSGHSMLLLFIFTIAVIFASGYIYEKFNK